MRDVEATTTKLSSAQACNYFSFKVWAIRFVPASAGISQLDIVMVVGMKIVESRIQLELHEVGKV
jgi:hypothetical protein